MIQGVDLFWIKSWVQYHIIMLKNRERSWRLYLAQDWAQKYMFPCKKIKSNILSWNTKDWFHFCWPKSSIINREHIQTKGHTKISSRTPSQKISIFVKTRAKSKPKIQPLLVQAIHCKSFMRYLIVRIGQKVLAIDAWNKHTHLLRFAFL